MNVSFVNKFFSLNSTVLAVWIVSFIVIPSSSFPLRAEEKNSLNDLLELAVLSSDLDFPSLYLEYIEDIEAVDDRIFDIRLSRIIHSEDYWSPEARFNAHLKSMVLAMRRCSSDLRAFGDSEQYTSATLEGTKRWLSFHAYEVEIAKRSLNANMVLSGSKTRVFDPLIEVIAKQQFELVFENHRCSMKRIPGRFLPSEVYGWCVAKIIPYYWFEFDSQIPEFKACRENDLLH